MPEPTASGESKLLILRCIYVVEAHLDQKRIQEDVLLVHIAIPIVRIMEDLGFEGVIVLSWGRRIFTQTNQASMLRCVSLQRRFELVRSEVKDGWARCGANTMGKYAALGCHLGGNLSELNQPSFQHP